MLYTEIDESGDECTYDGNDNLIHYKASDGYEQWYEYDKNGNMIHYKNSNGFEQWWEYGVDGKLIHWRNSNGIEGWYDASGNPISKEEYDKIYNH